MIDATRTGMGDVGPGPSEPLMGLGEMGVLVRTAAIGLGLFLLLSTIMKAGRS